MTPQEMLIGIDLILQKVNSNRISSIRTEEKLWFLNEEQIRILNQRTSPLSNEKQLSVEETQKRLDDVQSLVTEVSLDVYANDANSVYCYLPGNYYLLLNDRSVVKDLCGAAYNPTTASASFYYAKYQLPTTTDLWDKLVITLGGNVITLENYFPNGQPSLNSKFELIDFIIEYINNTPALAGFTAKYESYKGIYEAGAIIITRDTIFTMSHDFVNVTLQNASITVTQQSLTKISSVTGSSENTNRLVRGESLYNLLSSSIGGTLAHSPISSIAKYKLITYHKKKFIVSQTNIQYIRKPRKISLTLNQSCEFDEKIHQEIVENTAKRIAAYTSSQNYQQIINEKLLQE